MNSAVLEGLAAELGASKPTAVTRKRRGSVDPKGDDCARLTELGNSQRLLSRFGGRLRFCRKLGGWFVWDGARWRLDTTGQVVRFAKQVVRQLWRDAAACDEQGVRDAMLSHARRSEKAAAVRAMVTLAESGEFVAVDADAFDANLWILNCRNGIVDLRTGELLAHKPESMCRKIAPVAFDDGADAPLWTKFLGEILPDAEVLAFLQRFAGYVLSGVIRERVLVVLIGAGRNGKSLLIKLLAHLLGDYATYAAPAVLMAKDGQRHPTELADLCGIRFAAMSEVREGQAFDVETMKRLTGNEPIKARFMNEDFFQFEATFKLAMAANHRPRVPDSTDSAWDRLREVPFTVRIKDADEDKELYEKLCGELPGILNWCLWGCAAWQQNGLGRAAAVDAATDAYRASEDPATEFFDEAVVFEPRAMVTRKALREAYEGWAKEVGERHPLDAKKFSDAVRKRGGVDKRTGGLNHWSGTRLRTARDENTSHDGTSKGHPDHRERTPWDRTSPPAALCTARESADLELMSQGVPRVPNGARGAA